MYYSSGNYEAFARPEKPKEVDNKSAYLVGSGLASLSAACFLVRDGQMKGNRIHILEETWLPGGACDGINDTQKGFMIRGGRELENHYECLWDLLRSIPSLEKEGITVLDEFYWLNKKDPNYSLMRVTQKQGMDAHTDGNFGLSEKAVIEILQLFMTKDENLYDKKIEDVFSHEFFSSDFWLYFRTMFAFEEWHSALEMKLYMLRFLHQIGGLSELSTLKFTKYNQYDSLILPMVKYLESNGVKFMYDTQVTNVIFELNGAQKIAKQIVYLCNDTEGTISLTENDLVLVTNGSCVENATFGDQHQAPAMNTTEGGCWKLWRNIAVQDPSFGHPDKFCTNLSATNWVSATITTLDQQILPYIETISKRNPFSGKVVTGGMITVKDSSWLMSYTISRQPHFKDQPKDQLIVWLYGLFSEVNGNFINKPMKQCTGNEITQEWLYHLGVPTELILELAENSACCIPCMMPYITAFFMPRTAGDRPKVVPDGSINFAFIGQFADTVRDTVFTTEYSVRTAMEAVYTLLEVDRGVPEVFPSCYDIRVVLDGASKILDGKKITDLKLPFAMNLLMKKGLKKIQGTVIERILVEYHLL